MQNRAVTIQKIMQTISRKPMMGILRGHTSRFQHEENMQINPYWISGFVDGEGTFYVGINPHNEMSIGYQVLPEFRVVQHEKDIQVLYKLKEYFGCGVVCKNHDDRKEFRVRGINHISSIIIPFFERYLLQTSKKYDFTKFRNIVKLMEANQHLTKDGLIRIIDIASQMNRANKYKAIEIKRQLLE
jgi:hypothetical protein